MEELLNEGQHQHLHLGNGLQRSRPEHIMIEFQLSKSCFGKLIDEIGKVLCIMQIIYSLAIQPDSYFKNGMLFPISSCLKIMLACFAEWLEKCSR